MKYQYLGEDDNVFRVKHPDGSELHIAKKAVGPEVHKRIKSLEPLNMAEGGIVPELEDAEYDTEESDKLDEKDGEFIDTSLDPTEITIDESAPAIETPAPMAPAGPADPNTVGDLSQYFPEPAPAPMPDANPYAGQAVAPQAPSSAAPTPAPVAPGMEGLPASYTQPMGQIERGIKMGADAQAKGFEQQAQMQEQAAQELKRIEAETQKKLAPLEARSEELFNAVLNGKIEPSRLWNEMSTGNKVLAGISVLLSGLGAGMQGPGAKNMALEVLDKAVDRDIESQKINLGKKQTLFSENLRLMGDVKSAALATKSQYLSVMQAQIQSIMAKSNSAQALAHGQVLLGQFGMQKAAIRAKIAKDTALSQGLGNATDAQVQQLDKDVRERAVKVGSKWALALDNDSAKKAREIVGANEALNSNINELVALRKKWGSETAPGPIKTKMKTLAANLDLSMKEALRLGVLDKDAKEYMDKLVGDPTGFAFVIDKLEATKAAQNNTASQRLKALGIDMGQSTQSAPQIKTVKGVRYMRGPRGEAIRMQ